MKKILLFAAALMSSVTMALAEAVSIGGVYLEYDADVADLTAQINEKEGYSATGTISFNASTKTLTLNNATIESTGDKGAIEMYTNSTLNIVSLGENALKQTNTGYKSCIRSAQSSVLNISGSGSLTITSVQWYPIATDASCKITIDNTTVDLHATGVSYTNYGINNNSQDYGDVEIIKSHVKAGSINRVNSITLTGCLIASPADAVVEEHGINRENIVIVPSEITEVRLTATFPNAGDSVIRGTLEPGEAAYNVLGSVTLPENAGYSVRYYDFFSADGNSIPENKFNPATTYRMRIVLKPNEGYTFPMDGAFPQKAEIDAFINDVAVDKNNDFITWSDGTIGLVCPFTTAEAAMVATPVFSNNATYINNYAEITVTCGTEGASVYYTLDGTDPSESNGTLYSTPIIVDVNEENDGSTLTLKAIAIKDGAESEIVANNYSLNRTEYLISLVYDETQGTVSVPNYAKYNSTVTITAEAKEGFEIDKYIVDNVENAGNTFIMPRENITVKVLFKERINTAVDQNVIKDTTTKRLTNGQLLIIRDGKTYTPLGAEIK